MCVVCVCICVLFVVCCGVCSYVLGVCMFVLLFVCIVLGHFKGYHLPLSERLIGYVWSCNREHGVKWDVSVRLYLSCVYKMGMIELF